MANINNQLMSGMSPKLAVPGHSGDFRKVLKAVVPGPGPDRSSSTHLGSSGFWIECPELL